jgi:hypothetical protein
MSCVGPPAVLPTICRALLFCRLQGQMGLHACLVDAEEFSPLQGTVHVHTPQHHRPLHITDASGEFHMLLAPDILYCLSIHAVHPYRSSQTYYTIHVAVLRMGAQWMIKGTGPKGLTDRHLFLAERVYDSDVGQSAEQQQQQQQEAALSGAVGTRGGSSSSRSGGVGAARRLGHWQGNQLRRKHVMLGHARGGLCSDFLT